MIVPLSLLALAVALACRGVRAERRRSGFLQRPRGESLKIGIQIICGNCAGDEARPKRTNLMAPGVCEICGGRSYLLASDLARRPLPEPIAEPAYYEAPRPGRREWTN